MGARAVYRDSDRDHWVHGLLRKEDQCSMRCMNGQTRLQRPIAIYPRLNGEITALGLNLPSPGVWFQYSYHEMFLTDWLLIAGLCHRCCMIERPMSNWPLHNVLVKPSRIIADWLSTRGSDPTVAIRTQMRNLDSCNFQLLDYLEGLMGGDKSHYE
jgi:hypothetical protein